MSDGGRPREWTRQRVAILHDMRRSGYSWDDIAMVLGSPVAAVRRAYYLYARNNADYNPPMSRNELSAVIQRALRMGHADTAAGLYQAHVDWRRANGLRPYPIEMLLGQTSQ